MAETRPQPASGQGATAPESLLTTPGQRVEIDLFGKTVTGTIIRAGARSVAVGIPQMSDVRAMRIGTRVKALFAARGAVAEVTCGLSRMQDHIVLEFLSAPRLIQRRQHERFDLEVAVDLAWRDRTTNAWASCPALTRDVSGGGTRLVLTRSGRHTGTAPTPGAIVLLALSGGGEISARVLHVDGMTVRMEFIQPPEGFFDELLRTGRAGHIRREAPADPGPAGPAP